MESSNLVFFFAEVIFPQAFLYYIQFKKKVHAHTIITKQTLFSVL